LEHLPKPIIRGARNMVAPLVAPRNAASRVSSNVWPTSAELVGSAYKTAHIILRAVLDDTILIETSSLNWVLAAPLLRESGHP
jgi:hypothetical protein